MAFITVITSLINLAGISSWTQHPIMSLFLTIDGLIYTLVSYSFKLFMLMCQINYDSLSGILATLMDNLKALVMVFVVFKVGIQLIQFLLEPESAPKGGKEFLKNIFISAALLILYPLIMGIINEVGILIMGNDINYSFPILSRIAGVEGGNDEGLIMRFVFGDGAKDVEDVGDYLAYSTVTIFVHDINEGSGNREVKSIICRKGDGTCNFHDLPNIVPKLDKTIEYQWGICAIVGGFLVYSIVKNAIQLGVRMFKLVILQMLAPLAIISIVKDGPKGKIFSNFVSTYLKTFADAFVRMLTMLLVTVFVCKFFLSIDDFFGSNVTADMPRITRLLLTILIIVSAYMFAGQVPKFLDSILGTSISNGKDANLVGGLLGAGAGALTGAIGGAATAGVGGALTGAASGLVRGAGAGARSNQVSEFFKNQAGVASTSVGNGIRRANNKNGFWGAGLGYTVGQATGINAARNQKIEQEIKAAQDKMKADDDKFNTDYRDKYNEATEDYNNQMTALGDSDQRMQQISDAVENDLKGTNLTFQGQNVSYDASDEEIAKLDSVYRNTSAAYDAKKAEIEGKTFTSSDERTRAYRDLQNLERQRDQAHRQALDKVAETRNAARDDSASRLGYTGDEASVSGRKAIARANATKKRDLEIEKRSRDHEFATREKAHKDAQAAQQKNIDQMGKRKIS